MRRLSDAARQYAHGRQNQPLPVESADELGLLTETFNEMTDALERQEQLRTQMVADIAHELRMLRQTAAVWQIQAEKSDRQLVTDIPPNLPLIFYGARDRLGQVLTNLLSNALRYTPPGGIVTLAARQQEGEVSFWVQDSGPGLDEADLPNVFERFYRADQSRSRDTGGSGLGLAIAKQWVLLHGGQIWAENGPDGGAQFSVSLPAAGKQEIRGTRSSG